ncbi:MAG: hypothetical protein V4563_13965 [Pseudomonadota bacterium]
MALEQFVLDLRAERPAWGGRKLAKRLTDLGMKDIAAPMQVVGQFGARFSALLAVSSLAGCLATKGSAVIIPTSVPGFRPIS